MMSSSIINRILLLAGILSLFLMDTAVSQTSRTIRGTVLDAETGKSIPAVHVYFSQTTSGTTTTNDGMFEFSTTLTGVQKLVISFVGYKTETKEINLHKEAIPEYEIRLSPKAVELSPLEITASNKEWRENFEIFRKNFIGQTSIARNTKIENPWVLSFERDKEGTLLAKADRPLEITIHDLGYNVKIDLVEFRWPPHRSNSTKPGYYLFYSSYQELVPENGRQKRKWERNRRETYEGSFEHFLRSLYENDLRGNDFEVVLTNSQNPTEIPQLDSLNRSAILLHTSGNGREMDNVKDYKAYQLNYPVDVLYGSQWFNEKLQRSRLIPLSKGGIFIVTNQARLANPLDLRLDGAWSQKRVANILPVGYRPE